MREREAFMAGGKQIVEVSGLFDSRALGCMQCITAGNLVFVAGQGGLDERVQLVSPEFALAGVRGNQGGGAA